jgi:glycine cleavage system H lipoate-binding protein
MNTIITICTAYGIPDHILYPTYHEYCAALDIENCLDGISQEQEDRVGTIIGVELCKADTLNIADELRQHALRESDERVARALVVAADT